MSNSQAQLGYGSRLEFEMTDGMGDYQEIDEITEVPEFGEEFTEVEVSNSQSVGRRTEFIGGWKEGQQLEYKCNYFKSTAQEAVRAAKGTVRNFRHVITDGEETPTDILTITFPALIKNAKISAPQKEKKEMMISLRQTGNAVES